MSLLFDADQGLLVVKIGVVKQQSLESFPVFSLLLPIMTRGRFMLVVFVSGGGKVINSPSCFFAHSMRRKKKKKES